MMNLIKHSGQVFTPDYLVDMMLDYCGYSGNGILAKHVMDNSCGDGAFLCAVVGRYCVAALASGYDAGRLGAELGEFVHGIEKDSVAFANCLFNLDAVAAAYGVTDVRWDVMHADALTVCSFDGRMDYVVGNPPYVRVHNLAEDYSRVKTFRFANGGMTDLFLAFFELSLAMLRDDGGTLCYVTPSSWLNSKAASNFRTYIARSRCLNGLLDLQHFQAFDGVTTYSLVSRFRKGCPADAVRYSVFDAEACAERFVENLTYDRMDINGEFYVADGGTLDMLRKIRCRSGVNYVRVKNGFATLADSVFIGDIPIEEFTIPVIKASTGRWYTGFFPYDSSGKPLDRQRIFGCEAVAKYLNEHKAQLLKGHTENECPEWYLYGRTQALKDVFVDKLSVNTLIRDVSTVKVRYVPAGSGIYSGLYVISTVPLRRVEKLLLADDFVRYVASLKKYKSGGYYTFNSKDLEMYLNFKLSEDEHIADSVSDVECGLFASGF